MAEPFNNIAPRTREERNAENNKDAFEKNRIRARQGVMFGGDVPDNPLAPGAASPMHADAMDRFYRDAAAAEKLRGEQERSRKQTMYEGKRQAHFAREKDRWTRMDELEGSRAAHEASLRAAGVGNRANRASEHFNIVNLTYDDTPQGRMLKFHDDSERYRAMLRTQNLYEKGHSVPHNIITGERQASPVRLPAPPQRPLY